MSGAILSTITRTPLTKTDSAHATPSNASVTKRALHSESYNGIDPKSAEAVVDVHLKSRQSEIEKYLNHLSQAEACKADASHQGVGSTAHNTVTEAITKTSHKASDTVERPCFYGDFDLHTMSSQFLRNIYMGYEEPDHEALYEALTRYQATERVDARITLRKGLWENGSAVFADVRDPKSCIPIPLRLTLVTEMAIAYTDKELDLFVDRKDHLRTNVPGIFANLEFANVNERHCLSEGRFLMNRCWARMQPDGSVVEMFEGCMEFKVKGEMYFLGRQGEDINMIEHAFWAIRDHRNKVDLNRDEGSFD
ncbi:uncharacterized protein ARMOST_18531 [Armillaria ostoyae]|uniref:Uncharacterized protein n=1 Tax=Armillaria ostoyae TaxID=47428 RepID=A0A284S243_ARMOS|nr:uncharacterized protein ARMOST_18531 [Armillaria ostoyae]